MPRSTSTTSTRSNWRTGVVLESLVLAGLVGTQFVASAVVQDPSPAPARPGSQQRGHTSPPYLTGQLLVKYKDSVTACVHCLLKLKRPFHSATVDHSDSLDRLHARYQVTAATPIFRTEGEEAQIRGKAAQVPLVLLQQHQQQHLDAVKAKFPDRTKRAPPGAVVPELSQVYLLALPEETDLEQAVWEFSHDPHVEYAQPNYLMEAAWLPNDPYYSSSGSWGQPTTRGDYDDLWALKKIQAESAWDLSQGQGVVVAVIDTGLDYTHPDLAANVWLNPGEIPNNGVDDDGNGFKDDTKGWDFTNCLRYDGASCTIPKCAERFTDRTKCEDNDPLDDHGHGTHVAGTIAAVGHNGVGIVGVAPQAKVLAVKAHNSQGMATDFELARALAYAANNGADVLNNSWACPDLYPCPSNPVIEDAVKAAHSLGAVVVFAAGNTIDGNTNLADNSDVRFFSPQNMTNPKPIVVAATDHTDSPAYFTHVGLLLDLAAPGGGVQVTPPDIEPQRNILSLKAAGCNPTAANSLCPSSLLVGTNYLRQAGTSMAAPHAAGVAALVLAKTPSFTNEAIRQLLRASADDVGTAGVDVETGAGRLNATRALDVTAVPQVEITSPTFGASFLQEGGSVAITGTAAGSTFVQYDLAYGHGLFPMTWVAIAGPVVSQVTNGTLGTWVIGTLEDGTYTLRLVVSTSDGFQFQARVSVTLGRDPGLRQLTNAPAAQTIPAISGDRIVWEDGRNGNVDIYLYDLATDTEQQITTNLATQISPAISGDRIVWDDRRNGNADIYLYDLATNTERQITTHPSSQFDPAIDGDRIVWQDNRNGNYDIYLYDLATNTERQITSDLGRQKYPAISGDRIVWQDDRNGADDIYLYDLATNTERQITTNPVTQSSPAIDGDRIVWEDRRNSNWDIYLYDLATNTEREITTNPSSSFSPDIDGDRIVWYDSRNGNYDIYLYDLATNTEQQITTHLAPQYWPAIAGHRIALQDDRSGDRNIYLYELQVPPVLTPLGNQTVSEGQALTFTVSASDLNNKEPLTLTASSLPVGASFESLYETQTSEPGATANTFNWTPTCQQAGTYDVTFTATDPTGLSASEMITITVTRPDADGDGFADCVETYMGTDSLAACPATPTHAAWPPDFSNNRIVGIDDVFFVAGRFNASTGDPAYTPRAELASQDGIIGIDDVFAVSSRFNQSCP